MSMLFKRIRDWVTSITAFRTGDVIPVDGPNGTAKMPYSNLAKEVIKDSANNTAATEADLVLGSKIPIMTANGPKSLPGNTITSKTYAQNVAHSIAPEFDPTRNYVAGESCTYEGKVYIFTSNHNAGAWNEDDAVAFSANSLYALKSRVTTNPRFFWIKELFLPSTIPASSVSGIRAWCAYPNNENTEWWTGIQVIAGNEFYNFYRIFDNQTDASSFATSIFDIANNHGRLLALVDWDAIGGVGHKFELSRANLTPDCNNVAYMPTLHEYEIEKEIELENTNDKDSIKVYHLTLAAGVPSSSTNRASSGFIRTYKNSKIVFQNLHNMYVGFQIYYYDVLGRYVKNDTTHWTNETIDPNKSFVLDCVEDGFVRFLFRIRYDNNITDEIIGKLENGIKAIAKEKIWQNGKKNSFDIFTDVIADSYYSQFADKVNNSETTKLFAMQTDTHYSYFNGYSSYTQIRQMRKALKLALVPTIVNLGDLCNGWCPKPSHCSDVMHAIWDYSKFGNAYIQLVGNHDDNSWWEHEYGANKPAGVITPEEWHDMAYSKTKDYGVYMPYGKRYGSYDDVPNKVRYIFLDTLDIDYTLLNADGTLKYDGQWKSAIRQEQLDFLCQALLTRRDFRIVILSHHPLHSNGGVVNSNLVRGILEAYKNKTTFTGTSTINDFEASVSVDFSGNGTMVNAKLVGCFNGHTHADAIVFENGIVYVGTTCAFVPTDSQDRSSSDETMNAFDVVAITSTTCYLYRFGYGSDRSFVFDEETFLVNLPCAANTLRFEFSKMDYDPTVAGVGYDGTWKKVSAKFHNVWDWTKSGTSFNKEFDGAFRDIDNNVSVIAAGDTSAVTDTAFMFRYCTSLARICLFDTSAVTNMQYMFRGCTSLTNVPLFDTSAVTSMIAMFEDCTSLTSVPLFDTSAVTNMIAMFQGCTSLTNVPLFDTSAVTSMGAMFKSCSKVEGGALALYQQASTQSTPPSSHSSTFTNCGKDTVTGAEELAQIPASWGGTAP